MKIWMVCLGLLPMIALIGCAGVEQEPPHDEDAVEAAPQYADDLAFMERHVEVIELRDGQSAVAVVPAYQGRVMTSTFDRDSGPSFGWINRPVIAQGLLDDDARRGRLEDHIYVFGGEERFWFGPEGGQFSIYFPPEAPFEFENWKVPACIDTLAYHVTAQSEREVTFEQQCELVNWSGTRLHVGIERTVRLLSAEETAQWLGLDALDDAIEFVAYETENTIRNVGDHAWTRETGMLSIWLLGMYPPSDGTIMAIPIIEGSEEELGPKVNDAYFGVVPRDYLRADADMIFMKGDGTHRGKIGISPERTKWVAGSFDRDRSILNLVATPPVDQHSGYVNSMWELQDDPFNGDVINAYNDGPPTPGADPLGPFYELETSSPAAALAPGESLTHRQITVHLTGPRDAVDSISQSVLGASLQRIETAF